MRIIAWRELLALLFAAGCRPAPALVAHERAPAAAVTASATSAPLAALEHGLPPPRVGVPGSTRGTVACGAARCSVPREICVLVESSGSTGLPSWRCQPKERADEGQQSYACDDTSDCADGQACCLGFESAVVAYACSPRTGARANCALESCVEDGGTPCPASQACRAGACAPADARATCNGGLRCPPSDPICVWAKGVATCARELSGVGEPSPNELRMSCASNQDCGAGLRCCTNALGSATTCRVSCDAANNQELCQKDADCPAASSPRLYCVRGNADGSARFPPWVRICGAASG